MGAWGETAFANDTALDELLGYDDVPSLLDPCRVAAVIAEFLELADAGDTRAHSQEHAAYAACELVAAVNAEEPYGDRAGFPEEALRWLQGQRGFVFSEDVVADAGRALAILKSAPFREAWVESASRLEALRETESRLRSLPAPDGFAASRAPRSRPSALAERL